MKKQEVLDYISERMPDEIGDEYAVSFPHYTSKDYEEYMFKIKKL